MDIGIDVDGVLTDMTNATLPLMERDFGVHIEKSEISSWTYVPQTIGCSEREYLSRMDEAYASVDVPEEEEGVGELTQLLSESGYDVTIITRRTFKSHPYVTAWLHDHDVVYDALIFSGRKSKLAYPIDALIDDQPGIVDHTLKYPSKRIFLRTQPWNADVDVSQYPNVTRVSSLRDAIERIQAGKWA